MTDLKYKLPIFLVTGLLLAAFIIFPGRREPSLPGQVAKSGVFTAPTKKGAQPEKADLGVALRDNPQLLLYWRALKASGQDKKLAGSDRVTIFAPSNKALNNNRGIYDKLLVNKGQLRQTIKYTISKGKQERLKKWQSSELWLVLLSVLAITVNTLVTVKLLLAKRLKAALFTLPTS